MIVADSNKRITSDDDFIIAYGTANVNRTVINCNTIQCRKQISH